MAESPIDSHVEAIGVARRAFVNAAFGQIARDQVTVALRWRAMTARARDGDVDDLAGAKTTVAMPERLRTIA